MIIGSGNMANALGTLFSKKHKIVQVVSRNAKTGKKLAKNLDCHFSEKLKDVSSNADFYLLCVPDDEIEKVSAQLKHVRGILVHHSGAKSITEIKGKNAKAVIYPFVSVHPDTRLNRKKTTLFYEADTQSTGFLLDQLLSPFRFDAIELNSETRLKVHLAGVLVNNFTNHLYYKATNLTENKFDLQLALTRLALQAVENLLADQLKEKQTGPARRNDKKTMQKHLDLIKKDKELSEIYLSLSRSIIKTYSHE